MFYLWKEDGLNQNELALKANKEKSTITRQIDALEKKGLVYRQSHSGDKRNKLIFLSETGKQMEKTALETAHLITENAEQGIEPEELAIFKKVIDKMIQNLNS